MLKNFQWRSFENIKFPENLPIFWRHWQIMGPNFENIKFTDKFADFSLII